MTKTQDRQVYLDVAKGMGMLGVVASHCLVETSLGILSDFAQSRCRTCRHW